MFTATATRVSENTAEFVNEQIRQETIRNVRRFRGASPHAISVRLRELDEEWDIERCLETMSASVSLLGLGLGLTVNRKWLALPMIVQVFFLEHALQGWCPPIPVLRRLGIRTQEEIDIERVALKDLRGDFRRVGAPGSTSHREYEAVAAAEEK